jgi:hypothetical protein
MFSELLPIFLFHILLTALPAAAGSVYVAQRGVRSVPVLLAVGLAVSGVVAMASFWIYYGWPVAGKAFTVAIFVTSVCTLGFAFTRGPKIDRRLVHQLVIPLGLWAFGSAFVLFLGFSHGGLSSPLATASTRFSHPLPTDNVLPYSFSEWFYVHGHAGTPPVFPGGWLASDRPPLQMGYALAQRPGEWGNPELHYQVLGVLLQQFWIIGVWSLLLAGGVDKITRLLTMAMLLVSGTVLVNGFFVWPKLLPAAMLLAAIALLVTPEWFKVRRSQWGAVLLATLFGLALLGHGGSAFIAIPLVGLLLFRLPRWRWAAVGCAVAVVLLAPWSAYQKFGDPPGERVTKWMLAGDTGIDRRSTLEAISDGYSEVGFEGAVDNKTANFETMAGGRQVVEELRAAFSQGLSSIVRTIRIDSFFFFLPALGLLLIAPFLMLLAGIRRNYRAVEWSLAIRCFALVAAGCIVWGLLLFGSPESRAVIHQGTLTIPLLALCGLVLGMRASFPRFAVAFVGLNALLSLALYVPALDPVEGTSYSVAACVMAVVSLCLFLFVGYRDSDNAPTTIPPLETTSESRAENVVNAPAAL